MSGQTRSATTFRSTSAAARALGVDFKDEDPNYVLNLTSGYDYPYSSLEVLGVVFENFKMSDSVSTTHDVPLNQILLDLILMSRLPSYERVASYDRLLISTDVSLRVIIKDAVGNDIVVTSNAAWAIGFGMDKRTCDNAILLVLKADSQTTESLHIPQLLVAMSAVHSKIRGKVFGILLDGRYLHFGLLDSNNKFRVSTPLTPVKKPAHVLAYIDMMLWNVMKDCNTLPNGDQNSPPQKMSIGVASEYNKFKFEDSADDLEADGVERIDYEMVDLVNVRFPRGQVVFKSRSLLQ
ncbi:MAG: hypothetical protein Q9195_000442 [Heterodermia aff. obscurata]